jgi:hypothetical protein
MSTAPKASTARSIMASLAAWSAASTTAMASLPAAVISEAVLAGGRVEDVGHHDPGSLVGEPSAARPADAVAAPGDDGDLAGEATVRRSGVAHGRSPSSERS